MNITKEMFKKFSEKTLEIMEKFNFEPYCITFWGYGGIDLQGNFNSEIRKKINNNKFYLARKHEDEKTIFFIYQKGIVEIVLSQDKYEQKEK